MSHATFIDHTTSKRNKYVENDKEKLVPIQNFNNIFSNLGKANVKVNVKFCIKNTLHFRMFPNFRILYLSMFYKTHNYQRKYIIKE